MDEQVDDLIEKLGSRQFIERDKAQKVLLQIGESARKALEKTLKSGDFETRMRIQRILADVEFGLTPDDMSPELRVLLRKFQRGSLDGRFQVLISLVERTDFERIETLFQRSGDENQRTAFFHRSMTHTPWQVALLRANRFRWWIETGSETQPNDSTVDQMLQDTLTKLACLRLLADANELSVVCKTIQSEVPEARRDAFIACMLLDSTLLKMLARAPQSIVSGSSR